MAAKARTRMDSRTLTVKLEGSQTFETANCMDVFISELLDKKHLEPLEDVADLDGACTFAVPHQMAWDSGSNGQLCNKGVWIRHIPYSF